jgi:hypothetical protein
MAEMKMDIIPKLDCTMSYYKRQQFKRLLLRTLQVSFIRKTAVINARLSTLTEVITTNKNQGKEIHDEDGSFTLRSLRRYIS